MVSIHKFQSAAQRLSIIAIISMSSIVAGCASAPMPYRQADIGRATVTVENENWTDVQVYVISGSTTAKLGVVPTGSRATFKIPRVITLPADLEFLAASARGDQVKTESIATRQGDSVLFSVEEAIVRSSLLLRH